MDGRKTNDARILDYCSALLERMGAAPVPPADQRWELPKPGVNHKLCQTCHHPEVEHGATGECWMVNADGISVCDCTSGRQPRGET